MADSIAPYQVSVSGNISDEMELSFKRPVQTINRINCTFSNCSNGNTTDDGNQFIMEWYLQLFYSFAFVSMVLVAALGNLIVIWIVLAHRRMRTVTNYFLVNLALADALISVMNTLFNYIYMLNSDWPFGENYCRFSSFISPCTISASVFTFMAIAIDRYMAIIHPLKPRMTKGSVLGAIGVIWVVSVFIALPLALYSRTHTWYFTGNRTRTVCYTYWSEDEDRVKRIDFVYNLFLMLVNYFLPLLILAVTYSRVGLELWGSQAIGESTLKQVESVKNKRKVVKMMILVVVIFGVCWLPQHLYFIVSSVCEDVAYQKYIQHVYLIIYWLAMSNSMYNPFIYCWMNAKFRKGFKYVFRWLPFVQWSPADSLNRVDGTSIRFSMSDGCRYERNGSMMHTIVETMDTSCSSAPINQRKNSMELVREDHVRFR